MKITLLSGLCFGGVILSASAQLTTNSAGPADRSSPKDAASEMVVDVPGLPRVLLIGDSISIGYTAPVRRLLQGKANVHRIPENGGPTTNGLIMLRRWIGNEKWDVIHFNWGLHDLKIMPDGYRQVSPEAYEKNLRQLVLQLKTTKAKLIWASTTPVPAVVKEPPRHAEDVPIYNSIAKNIMARNRITIDDLYAFALPRLSKIQRPANVHFTDEGSEELAKKVAASIDSVLPKKNR